MESQKQIVFSFLVLLLVVVFLSLIFFGFVFLGKVEEKREKKRKEGKKERKKKNKSKQMEKKKLSKKKKQVVYSANSGSTPYFVIPLFFTEAIPILFVTFFLCPSHIKRFFLFFFFYSFHFLFPEQNILRLISSARSSAASIEREQTNTKDVSMAQL